MPWAALLSFNSFGQSGGDARAQIAAANKQFIALFSQGGAGVADLYTSNAILIPPNSNFVEGREAIRTFWKGGYDAGIKKVALETVNVDASGILAQETGKYILYGVDDKEIDSGKYLVVWKNEKGKWKLYRDIWNTSAAAK